MSLSLEPTDFRCLLERFCRYTRRTIFFSVEAAEMLPYDFVGGITLNALCACVPTRHVAFLIELKNGVVNDSIY